MFNFLKLFFCAWILFWSLDSSASFKIVEVFPNTVDDSSLESVSITNLGDEAKSLSGYILKDLKKEYQIFSDIFLESGEVQVFLRPETKLALNNTNEEIFLYSSDDELIDSVEYKKSVKGQVIYFGEEISEEVGDNIEEFNGNETGSGDVVTNEEKLTVLFDLQRPSYITRSGSTDTYICDSGEEECKVNFNFESSFSEDFKKGDYNCKIDFGGIGDDEDEKCNPNTVIFPEGESIMLVQIVDKESGEIVTEKQIEILFDRSLPSFDEKILLSQKPKLALRKPTIIIQSGLIGRGTNFYCEKQPCKFNLDYKKIHSGESCFWNFGPGLASSESTRTRCNPGYVDIPEGLFELSLRVFEKNYPSNSKTRTFYIHNIPAVVEAEIVEEEILENTKEKEVGIDEIFPQIVLQGKISKEKTLSGSSLDCRDVEKCYVNFIADNFQEESFYSYSWKRNGEVFSEDINPKGTWLENGQYSISFEISRSGALLANTSLEVGVHEKVETIEIQEHTEEISEPVLFVDTLKKIDKNKDDLKGRFTQNYLVLKYDGLRISGKLPAGSKIEIYNNDNLIVSGKANEKGKYRLVTKKLKQGEYALETKIILAGGKEYFLVGKSVVIESSDLAFWYQAKTVKRSAKKVVVPKIPQLIIKSDSQKLIPKQAEAGIFMKIFMSIIVILCGIFGGLHLLYTSISNISQSVMSVYSLRFNTKQKVCLIL